MFFLGDGAAVLIRALQPLQGMDEMTVRRSIKKKPGTAQLKEKQLTNGPSKLTQALAINKENTNQVDLNVSGDIWLEDRGVEIKVK